MPAPGGMGGNRPAADPLGLPGNRWPTEYMHLYTADGWEGTLAENCPEGDLAWVKKEKVPALPLWEGDRIFLRLLEEAHPFFSLKLVYEGDHLIRAVLDGKELPR